MIEIDHADIIKLGTHQFANRIREYNQRALTDLLNSYRTFKKATEYITIIGTVVSIQSAVLIQISNPSTTPYLGFFCAASGILGASSIYLRSGAVDAINLINGRLSQRPQQNASI